MKLHLGRRERQILEVLVNGNEHSSKAVISISAELEIRNDGESANDARAYLDCEGSTARCFWRMDSHVSIKNLIEKKCIIRVERGWYQITETGRLYLKEGRRWIGAKKQDIS